MSSTSSISSTKSSGRNGLGGQHGPRRMLLCRSGSSSPGPGADRLPTFIQNPTRIQAAGSLPKLIDEYVGRVNTREQRLSIAHMRSPAGWTEPAQTPEFEEYTIVLKGCLRVSHEQGTLDVTAGQAVIAH